MSDQASERTEQATSRRREEARRKGQVAVSRDISSVVALGGTVALGSLLGAHAFGMLTGSMRQWLAGAGTLAVTEATLQGLVLRIAQDVLWLAVPFGLALLVLGSGAHLLQTGWVWSTERLRWDLGRLNPIAGLKRMVSLRATVELAKALLKIAAIGAVVYWNLKDEILAIPLMLQMETGPALFMAGRMALTVTAWVAGALVVLAVADYGYQRWQLSKDLRMSRQEVKQEQKETEGDPLIRSRIRSLQRQAARRRMMAEVPKSDVVITNPSHLAVALRYDGVRMAAPVVVAKGAGFIAERIRQIAAEHGIPIIENKPLARSLHKVVEVGREIPVELYQAVAEILALVLRARGKV